MDAGVQRRVGGGQNTHESTLSECCGLITVVWQDVCFVYGQHNEQSMNQSGKVGNPARGQLNKENDYFPVSVHA